MFEDTGNGANLIVLNPQDEILVVRQNYKQKLWILPGGKIERGESPTHAAHQETHEETGIITHEEAYRLIAWFVQKPNGVVFLFETRDFHGTLRSEPDSEILEARFMSFDEIVAKKDEFSIGYLRMIIRYMRCVNEIDRIPYEGRLSEPVEYPREGFIYAKSILAV